MWRGHTMHILTTGCGPNRSFGSEHRACEAIHTWCPLWFLWDGARVLLFSLPNTRKLRDLAANSAVVLALEAADQGYDIVILQGRATLLNDPDVTPLMPSFVGKYANIRRRWPAEEWAQKFSKTIQVIPTKLTGWITKPGSAPARRSLRFQPA